MSDLDAVSREEFEKWFMNYVYGLMKDSSPVWTACVHIMTPHIRKPLEDLLGETNEALEACRSEAMGEINRLQKLCDQRGERMKVMADFITGIRKLNPKTMEYVYFLELHPEATDWFDEEGEPK